MLERWKAAGRSCSVVTPKGSYVGNWSGVCFFVGFPALPSLPRRLQEVNLRRKWPGRTTLWIRRDVAQIDQPAGAMLRMLHASGVNYSDWLRVCRLR